MDPYQHNQQQPNRPSQDWGSQEEEKVDPNQPPSTKIKISFGMPLPSDQLPDYGEEDEEGEYYDEDEENLEDNEAENVNADMQGMQYTGEAVNQDYQPMEEDNQAIQDDNEFFQYTPSMYPDQNAGMIPQEPIRISSFNQPLSQPYQESQPYQPTSIQLNLDKITIGGPPNPQVQQQQPYQQEYPQKQGESTSISIPNFNQQPVPQTNQPVASLGIQIPMEQFQTPYQSQPTQQQFFENTEPKEKKSKKKKKKKKGKGSIMELYDLKKIKLTMEINTDNKRARCQAVYTLNLKSEEQVSQYIQTQINDGIGKSYLDLALQTKMVTILEACLLSNKDASEKTQLKFDYPQPKAQAEFQETYFIGGSKDMHSYETKQQAFCQEEQKVPIFSVKRLLKLNFKAENIQSQLKPKLKFLVTYFIESLSNFGIKEVQYKKHQSYEGQQKQEQQNQLSSYFYTSDAYGASKLWLPLVETTQTTPVQWTLRYIVPSEYTVVSSGVLISKQTENSNQSNPSRSLYVYKIGQNDASVAEKVGFVIGQFPILHRLKNMKSKFSQDFQSQFVNSKKEETSKFVQGFLTFFMNPKKEEIFKHNNLYEKIIDSITNYLEKLVNHPYPVPQNKIVFVPNLFEQSSRKQSLDFSGGLHIMDEEILFQRNQLEYRHKTYKYLASTLAFDYFGGKAIEETPEDYWLTLGIRESLGNHFKIAKCGVLIYRYYIMKTIENLYKAMKKGLERYPLQTNNLPNPQEQQLNDLVFQKCELIMHMIESIIDKSYYERIIRQLFASAQPTLSAGLFLEIFKEVCGFKLKQFCTNWILSTSCPKLTASFQYNKKNNSLDLTITQSSAMKEFFMFRHFLKDCIDKNILFSSQFKSTADFMRAQKMLKSVDSFFVELKRECMRWFSGQVNVMIYLTDGAEIQTQQQKMSLKFGKTTVSVNIPLQTKVKKTIQNKKKEYENYAYEDMGQEQEEDYEEANPHQHILDNNSWKFGLNDFELEEYPYGTKNLFEVKNLDQPILWIRVDPDMEYIRKVEVKQAQNNWLFQLLQEKDIIGQIEAIQELRKLNTELVYEIMKSVSVNENYFFKVRKEALKGLQKMQTSQFNKYLSHEKFLIKIFNQRNYDPKLGFYKSNDFTKILEYYFDKYTLKILAKCKEQPLKIREEIKEQQIALIKQHSAVADGVQLSINEGEISQVKSTLPTLDETQFNISSEQTAQMLLKLLQENDNSENPFDDSFYIKQILSSLGSLDNFKYMPEIALEIYRQFRLDHIGKFSPLFSVTKGTISGYFNLRKQIYKFQNEKRLNMDPRLEELAFAENQIQETEKSLSEMQKELERIVRDENWPYQIRMHILYYQVKHAFLYEKNSFLKALFTLLKQVDAYQCAKNYRMAVDLMRKIAQLVEEKWIKLDFREAYLVNERSKAILTILWAFLCLPTGFLDAEFPYWVKRLYHQLYNHNIPPPIRLQQEMEGVKIVPMEYDEYWTKEEEGQDQVANDDKDKNLNRMLASRSAQVIIRTPKNELVEQHDQMGADNKLKIVLGGIGNPQSTFRKQESFQRQQSYYEPPIGGPIKISLGGIQIPTQPNQQDDYTWQGVNYGQQEQPNQVANDQQYDENESIYDEFAEITFDVEWMQRAWEVLGLLWYHEESSAFLYPVTENELGSYYEEYIRVITHPMDYSTIKQKMLDRRYASAQQFKMDVQRVFTNCKTFNHEDSEIYQAANKLEVFFWEKVAEYLPVENRSIIRIN